MIILTQRTSGFDHCVVWGWNAVTALQNRRNTKLNPNVIDAWSFRATSMEDMELVETASALFIPEPSNSWTDAIAA